MKGASLDTHRRWQAELTRMAGVLEALSYAVLALICISAIAIVIFATRTVLDANRRRRRCACIWSAPSDGYHCRPDRPALPQDRVLGRA